MEPDPKSIPAGKFKAKCLAILDQVARRGEEIIVTKRGKPVAKVVPVKLKSAVSLRGSVVFRGDIVSPIIEEWELEK